MKPSIASIVHYVSYGTPGGEFTKQCRAAIVTEVDPSDPDRIGLTAINPTGMFFHSLAAGGCKFNDGAETPGDPDCPHAAVHGSPKEIRELKAELVIITEQIRKLCGQPWVPHPGDICAALIVSREEVKLWLAAHPEPQC